MAKQLEGFSGASDCALSYSPGQLEFTHLTPEERREEDRHSPNLVWMGTTTRHFSPSGLSTRTVPFRWYERAEAKMTAAPKGWNPKA